ncbi:MAG: OmpA family protein, partial [Chthoniobacterales bacterium]
LIKRNPKAKFTIEGYSDTFGTADYNRELSQRRADSVARYLVEGLGINPSQVQTRGYGAAKLLVQPRAINSADPAQLEMEIARQRPNRRVVVVVNTNG